MKTKICRFILIVMGVLYIPFVFLVPFGQRKTVSDTVSSTVSSAVEGTVGSAVANVIGDAVSDVVEDALPEVPVSVERLCPVYLTAYSALHSISEVTLAVKMGELILYYAALFLIPAVCGTITVLLNAIGRKRPSLIATIVLCAVAAVFFCLTEYNMAARFSILYKDTYAAAILCAYSVIGMAVAVAGCVMEKPHAAGAAEKTPWVSADDTGSGDRNFASAGVPGGYAADSQGAGPGSYASGGQGAGSGSYVSGGQGAGPGGYASGGQSAGPGGCASGGQGALHGLTGDYMDADIPLDPGAPVVIGSDPRACSVVLAGGDISGKHLVVQWMGNGNYQVTDYSYLGSFDQYGNRLPTASAVTMHSGDTVRVGSEAFRLV